MPIMRIGIGTTGDENLIEITTIPIFPEGIIIFISIKIRKQSKFLSQIPIFDSKV
jgi:hypothetical protein